MYYLMSEAQVWMLWCLAPVAGFPASLMCHLSLQVRKATKAPVNAIRIFQQSHWKHCSCLFSGVLLISHAWSSHKPCHSVFGMTCSVVTHTCQLAAAPHPSSDCISAAFMHVKHSGFPWEEGRQLIF